jgi:hypothetical protein
MVDEPGPAIFSAASRPERSPHSWKPWRCHAPAKNRLSRPCHWEVLVRLEEATIEIAENCGCDVLQRW